MLALPWRGWVLSPVVSSVGATNQPTTTDSKYIDNFKFMNWNFTSCPSKILELLAHCAGSQRPASRNINKRASVLTFLSQTHQSDARVKEHPLGEDRRQVCRSGSSRARNISHSAEIDWPWRSMWTLSMSNEAPPSSTSAPPEAI